MNVLSLFDGMSCGRIALQRAGIKVDNYFSSEIDKYALKVANKNWPQDEVNRLGDVRSVKASDLPKIDLLIGGSPCQSFSFAGKRKGMSTKDSIEILSLDQYLKLKEEGFEFEGQSYLFWEYMRLLRELQPKYFLLENVKMSKKWKDVLSEAIGVEPILINSVLVSAQNRQRLYWTNIPNVEQPEDKGIVLKDVSMKDIDSKFYIKNNSYSYLKTGQGELRVNELKNNYNIIYKDGLILCSDIKNDTPSGVSRQADRLYSVLGKSPCLTTSMIPKIDCESKDILDWRFIIPVEAERLQTVPDNYTEGVSDAQRYKMLGNGWTVDVIAHIFKNIE